MLLRTHKLLWEIFPTNVLSTYWCIILIHYNVLGKVVNFSFDWIKVGILLVLYYQYNDICMIKKIKWSNNKNDDTRIFLVGKTLIRTASLEQIIRAIKMKTNDKNFSISFITLLPKNLLYQLNGKKFIINFNIYCLNYLFQRGCSDQSSIHIKNSSISILVVEWLDFF